MSTGRDNPAGGMSADVVSKAVAKTAVGSVKHLHYARLVSPDCAKEAGLQVKVLQCGPGCDIPAKIWLETYPKANGLRVDISKGSAQQRSHPIISDLLEKVPEGRLRTVAVAASAPVPAQQLEGQAGMPSQDVTDEEKRLWGRAAASTIRSSKATENIEEAIITLPIPASDANGILTDLQRLQQLQVRIEDGMWAPAAGEQLRALKVGATVLDIAALKANCPLLEVLHLEQGASATNWEQLPELVPLKELLVLDRSTVPLELLAQLPELRILELASWDLQPQHWALIAAMKKLTALKVRQALLPAAGPASTSLTSLEATHLRTPEPGTKLSQLAPELQRLGVLGYESDVPTGLHTAAEGHPKLRALLLHTAVAQRIASLLADLLKSLPALQEMELVGVLVGARSVLSAAANCSRLRRLGFTDDAKRACCTTWPGGAPGQALGSGSAAASLQSVQLGTPHAPLTLQAAARLLQALHSLQQAVLYVQVLPRSEAPTSEAQQQARHPALAGLVARRPAGPRSQAPWPAPLIQPPAPAAAAGDRQRARELCAWLGLQLRAAGCLVQADGEELQEVDRSVVLRGVGQAQTWAARVTEVKLRVNSAAVRLCVVEAGP